MIVIFGISSLPTVIGTLIAVVVFVYLMRGVGWLERVRSEAVFGMGLAVPPRNMSDKTGLSRWFHQIWLDLNSTRFWKGCTHHFVRLAYDMAAGGLALALLAFAFFAPAGAISIGRSGTDAGVTLIPPVLAWPLAVLAFAVAVAIVVFAPALDAKIDSWLLPPSPTAVLKHEMNVLADARMGALTSAQTERYRIERDLHDSVQPRLVSLAMTIGLAQTKLDTDPAAAKALIGEAHEDAKTALLELRNVVRGIAPTILADRGLDAALSSVVQRAAVPTLLNIDLPHRISEETESVAYFIVAEALTNVAKHAQASRAVVSVQTRPGRKHAPRLGIRRRSRRRADHRQRHRHRPARSGRAGTCRAGHVHGFQSLYRVHDCHRGIAMRIVIAEDSALLRAGIERILTDAGHDVVGSVPDASNLLRLVSETRPDLVIVDVRMPPTFTDEGIRCAAALRSQNPESPVLVLSHYVEERYASELITADTRGFGYLLKDRVADVPAFLDAVSVVGSGGTLLDPEVVSQILARSHRRSALDQLTPREIEVLAADGRRQDQLGDRHDAAHVDRFGRETHRLHLREIGAGSR